MKTRKHFIGMAFVAILVLAFAIIGCKNDEPTLVPPNEVSVGGFKVTINNHGLLSAEKLGILKKVISEVLTGQTLTGNLTINVIASDGSTFTPDGSRTLIVGATWMATATESQIKISLGGRVDTWIAHATGDRHQYFYMVHARVTDTQIL
jgi:hypothetical protein